MNNIDLSCEAYIILASCFICFPLRSSLYAAVAHQPPHSLITAQISPPPEGAGGVGIRVATFPGEVMGCVIVQLEEHMDNSELLAGDRFA